MELQIYNRVKWINNALIGHYYSENEIREKSKSVHKGEDDE